MSDIPLPQLSGKDPDAEGVVSTWFVADGDQVTEGQLVGEVMVDKVSGEVTAPAGGRIRLLCAEDEVRRQGEPIARIE
jgi:pyruvate/2-oxoglutarate dehydrogenase complex dihydrolipoamide acyltransferase (E2) component